MENIGESIGEPTIENDESVPLTIEKKPRKKRETQSTAQLETLKRGREKLAEKRQKLFLKGYQPLTSVNWMLFQK